MHTGILGYKLCVPGHFQIDWNWYELPIDMKNQVVTYDFPSARDRHGFGIMTYVLCLSNPINPTRTLYCAS